MTDTQPPTREQVRSGRARDVRKQTINLLREPAQERHRLRLLEPFIEHPRPSSRLECIDGPRPCPFVGCRHHLFLDVTPNGNITLNFPDLEPDEVVDSCSLDVAAMGGLKLEDVGARMNLTRERARQVEVEAIRKLERNPQFSRLLREFR